MAHYNAEGLMVLGMRFLLHTAEFDELISEMKYHFNCYENGFILGGEAMDKILVEIDEVAYDLAAQGEIEGDEDMKVFNTARTFLLGILFEYIGHSNLEPDQFIKLITNRE